MPSGASCNSCGTSGPVRIARENAVFPARFNELSNPPDDLWAIGSMPPADLPLVGMVGARAASGHGCKQARDWAEELGRAGLGGHRFRRRIRNRCGRARRCLACRRAHVRRARLRRRCGLSRSSRRSIRAHCCIGRASVRIRAGHAAATRPVSCAQSPDSGAVSGGRRHRGRTSFGCAHHGAIGPRTWSPRLGRAGQSGNRSNHRGWASPGRGFSARRAGCAGGPHRLHIDGGACNRPAGLRAAIPAHGRGRSSRTGSADGPSPSDGACAFGGSRAGRLGGPRGW